MEKGVWYTVCYWEKTETSTVNKHKLLYEQVKSYAKK